MLARIPRPIFKALFILHALVRRPMTLGVRAVLRDGDGKVLLVRHTYVDGWHLPGGGVERNETMIKALIKEVREEVSIVFDDRPHLFNIYKNSRASRFDHVAVYICERWTSLGDWQANGEIAEMGFFALDDLPTETTGPTHTRLQEVFGDQPVEDVW